MQRATETVFERGDHLAMDRKTSQDLHAADESNTSDVGQEILPGLFLGSLEAALSHTWCKQHNITHIVSALIQSDRERWSIFPAATQLLLRIEDSASQDMTIPIRKVHTWIDDVKRGKPNTRVLIHCRAGISRSATLMIAYMIRSLQYTAESALALVQSKRPQAQPIEGFLQQLKDLAKSKALGMCLVRARSGFPKKSRNILCLIWDYRDDWHRIADLSVVAQCVFASRQ